MLKKLVLVWLTIFDKFLPTSELFDAPLTKLVAELRKSPKLLLAFPDMFWFITELLRFLRFEIPCVMTSLVSNIESPPKLLILAGFMLWSRLFDIFNSFDFASSDIFFELISEDFSKFFKLSDWLVVVSEFEFDIRLDACAPTFELLFCC